MRSKAYLETHMGLLTTGDVLARVWDRDNRNVVVMTSQEVLLSWDNVSNDNSGTKWEDDVLIIWMQSEPAVDLA